MNLKLESRTWIDRIRMYKSRKFNVLFRNFEVVFEGVFVLYFLDLKGIVGWKVYENWRGKYENYEGIEGIELWSGVLNCVGRDEYL